MQIENTIEIHAPIDRVWTSLLDVPRVASCVPGGELTEVVDTRTWKGTVAAKLGPMSLRFAGTVVLEEQDDTAKKVVLKASGKETRGKGSATAVVTSRLEALDGDITRVEIATDLSISGALAQFGRGMIADVSQRMAADFAECLSGSIADEGQRGVDGVDTETHVDTGTEGMRSARPVGGLRLAVWAITRAIARSLGGFIRGIAGVFVRRRP